MNCRLTTGAITPNKLAVRPESKQNFDSGPMRSLEVANGPGTGRVYYLPNGDAGAEGVSEWVDGKEVWDAGLEGLEYLNSRIQDWM